MKKCFKCQLEKPLEDFYKHIGMKDGRLNKCIECNKKDAKGQYVKIMSNEDLRKKEQKRARIKGRKRLRNVQTIGRNSRYFDKYPEKKKAKNIGSAIKKPFEGAESHHWSYLDEHLKDVIFLSKQEHMKSHRFIIYDQERLMYRRSDTNELLDSKEKHSAFIQHCIKNEED